MTSRRTEEKKKVDNCFAVDILIIRWMRRRSMKNEDTSDKELIRMRYLLKEWIDCEQRREELKKVYSSLVLF